MSFCFYSFILGKRHTDRQTDRHKIISFSFRPIKDKQTDSQPDKQTDSQTNTQKDTDRQTRDYIVFIPLHKRQTDKRIDKHVIVLFRFVRGKKQTQTDRQKGRQTDMWSNDLVAFTYKKKTDRQAHKKTQTDRHIQTASQPNKQADT